MCNSIRLLWFIINVGIFLFGLQFVGHGLLDRSWWSIPLGFFYIVYSCSNIYRLLDYRRYSGRLEK